MKTKNFTYLAITTAFVILFTISSCSNTKYAALDCPDFSSKPSITKKSPPKLKRSKKIFASNSYNKNRAISRKKKSKSISSVNIISASEKGVSVEAEEDLELSLHQVETPDNSPVNSEIETPDVSPRDPGPVEILITEEATYVIEKDRYSPIGKMGPRVDNSYFDVDRDATSVSSLQQMNYIPMDGLAIAGFISGIVGLLVFGIPLGAIAIIFGALSLSKINKYPDKFRGRGLATASLVLGIIDVVGVILLLLIM